MLEIEFVDIVPQSWAFSSIIPGLGFLRDLYTDPYMVHWNIADGWATSAQIPGVRVPGASFMGVSGVAPSHQQLKEWTDRENVLIGKGGNGVAAGRRWGSSSPGRRGLGWSADPTSAGERWQF